MVNALVSGVTVIVFENRHGDLSSNPGSGCCISHRASTVRYEYNYSPSSEGEIVGQTRIFNLAMVTDLGERKL